MIKVFVNKVQQKPDIFIKININIKIHFKCRNEEDLKEQLQQLKKIKLNFQKIVICSCNFVTSNYLQKKLQKILGQEPDVNYSYLVNYIRSRVVSFGTKLLPATIKNISPIALSEKQINKIIELI